MEGFVGAGWSTLTLNRDLREFPLWVVTFADPPVDDDDTLVEFLFVFPFFSLTQLMIIHLF